MLYSRIEALEVRTIKVVAMSKDKKQYHDHSNILVEGVCRAKRMEAAAQKVAVAKRRQINIHTHNLQRFEDLVKSSSWPMQHANSKHAGRCTDDTRHPSISGNIHSKREEPQEPDADPQQSPNSQRTKKEQQTRAERNSRAMSAHAGAIIQSCYGNATRQGRAYAKPVHLTNHYKEDHLSPGLKQSFLCDESTSKFVQKRH